VTYVKKNINYLSKIAKYAGLVEKGVISTDDLFDNNLDEVFTILGKMSLIRTGCFYVENLYFRHQNWAIHFCENGVFKYAAISHFTKTLWHLQDHEVENGIPIPKRFVKINAGIVRQESLAFLLGNELLRKFIGNIHIYIGVELMKKLGETKLVLFGAGKDGKRILTALRRSGYSIAYFCDNSEKLWDTTILNVKVISLTRLKELSRVEKLSVIITSSNYYREIKSSLADIDVEILNDGLDEPIADNVALAMEAGLDCVREHY
jgi:FlaA1/EpsC-like NDP-sugar epimerase